MTNPKRISPRGPVRGVRRACLPFLILLLNLLALAPAPLSAQSSPGKAAAPAAAATDIYGRNSPRGLATGLISALAAEDYERARQYFDLSNVRASRRDAAGIDYARRLEAALDAGGSLVQPVQLSSDPSGRIDDQLPADQERIGSLRAKDGVEEVPLVPVSSQTDEGESIWLLSAATLAALPAVEASAGGSTLRNLFPPLFRNTTLGGAPLADWLILIGGALFCYLVVRLACALALRMVRRIHGFDANGLVCRLLQTAPTPFSLWLSMLIFLGATRTLEVAFVARQLVGRFASAIAFLAFAWFLWRMIDVAAELVAARMEHRQRFRARSIIIFVRRALKLLLLMFAGVQALNILGVDVTTGIAALGLGGLAIALGAQKTVENVVGSVSVVADEPVRVGDFCKVGDVTGTVEDIGIRSTRIRTNDRTRITIPNSTFSSQQIENFAARDRFLFAPTLRLAYGIDADGVERVLTGIRAALANADYLVEGARANFKGFGESSLDVEIFGYIDTADGNEFVTLQERLLLDIMRRVEAAGASLAVPARLVRMDAPLESDRSSVPAG
jgi:MscS family membrane protein